MAQEADEEVWVSFLFAPLCLVHLVLRQNQACDVLWSLHRVILLRSSKKEINRLNMFCCVVRKNAQHGAKELESERIHLEKDFFFIHFHTESTRT